MMASSGFLGQSSRSLRQLLVGYWLGSSLLIGVALTLLDAWDHRQMIVREGDQATHMVVSNLRSSLSDMQIQEVLESYDQSNRQQRFDRVNLMLVLDRKGRIAYSSRPTWRNLMISDPLMDQIAGEDPDFRAVVECFRRNRGDCMELRSEDWHVHLTGASVVRPVSIPSRSLGLPREPLLVIVNFDAGMVFSDLLQDLPGLFLIASLISLLLSASLWIAISGRLLPQLIEAGQTDSLTQLINRTTFMDMAMELLAEAEERGGDLVFAILDIDHFKRINDTYGHGCGDAALASVGSLLLTVTRPEDHVCRFGGEEFALLLSVSREDGNKVLERLRLQLSMNRLSFQGHRIPLTASIGAAATSQCGYNLDFLYNAADKALYTAKNRGRDRLEWNAGDLISRLPASPMLKR